MTDEYPTEEPESPESAQERKRAQNKKYGYKTPHWDGVYRKVMEVMSKLPAFREWFMENRYTIDGKKVGLQNLVVSFNDAMPPEERDFYPYMAFVSRHAKVWDIEAADRKRAAKAVGHVRREIAMQLVATPEQAEEIAVEIHLDERTRERRVETLGDALVDDAYDQLMEAQEEMGVESDDELMLKKRKYALNVYSHVTKAEQKGKELKLKMSAENRENAGFMLNLMNRAQAGNLTEEELNILSNSVTPDVPEKVVEVTAQPA